MSLVELVSIDSCSVAMLLQEKSVFDFSLTNIVILKIAISMPLPPSSSPSPLTYSRLKKHGFQLLLLGQPSNLVGGPLLISFQFDASFLQQGAQNRTQCSRYRLTSVGWRRIITYLKVLPTALLMKPSTCLVFSLRIDGKKLLCVHLLHDFIDPCCTLYSCLFFQVGKSWFTQSFPIWNLFITKFTSVQPASWWTCTPFNRMKIENKSENSLCYNNLKKIQTLKQERWRTVYRASRERDY